MLARKVREVRDAKKEVVKLNKHLAEVQQSIDEFLKKDTQHGKILSDCNLSIRLSSSDENNAKEIREMLFNLQRRLNSFTSSSSQLELCKKNIHEALCYLTIVYPLNKNTNGKFICPLSKKPINLSATNFIALSNGYYYRKKAIDEERADKPNFPALPNISQYDADAVHGYTKKLIIISGMAIANMTTPVLVMIDMILMKLVGASLAALAVKTLALLGITGMAAVAIPVGGFFIALAALAAIAIVIACAVYDKQNGSKLAPVSSTTSLLGEMPRDESRFEHEEDESLSLLPAPAAPGSEKIVKLDVVKPGSESDTDDDILDAASGASFK